MVSNFWRLTCRIHYSKTLTSNPWSVFTVCQTGIKFTSKFEVVKLLLQKVLAIIIRKHLCCKYFIFSIMSFMDLELLSLCTYHIVILLLKLGSNKRVNKTQINPSKTMRHLWPKTIWADSTLETAPPLYFSIRFLDPD